MPYRLRVSLLMHEHGFHCSCRRPLLKQLPLEHQGWHFERNALADDRARRGLSCSGQHKPPPTTSRRPCIAASTAFQAEDMLRMQPTSCHWLRAEGWNCNVWLQNALELLAVVCWWSVMILLEKMLATFELKRFGPRGLLFWRRIASGHFAD